MAVDHRVIERLHQNYLNGDKQAGWQIVELVADTIDLVSRRIGKRRGDADDLRQDMCIILYESLLKYDPSRFAIESWTAMVASRRLPKRHFVTHGATRVESAAGLRYERVDSDSYLEDHSETLDSDELEGVHAAMSCLADPEREALRLHTLGKKYHTIGKAIGSSPTTAKKVIERAVSKVRLHTGQEPELRIEGDRQSQLREHEAQIRTSIDELLELATNGAKLLGIDAKSLIRTVRNDIRRIQSNPEVVERSFKKHQREIALTC